MVPVPAIAMLGFWVLGDGGLVFVGESHGLGVPGDGDVLALTLVAAVELDRQNADKFKCNEPRDEWTIRAPRFYGAQYQL